MRTVSDIYHNIGQLTFNELPDVWTKAIIKAVVLDGVVELTGAYETASELGVVSLNVDDALFDDFEDLNTIMGESGNNWNRAEFTLTPDGKFNIEFGYDQELNDEIDRLSKE